MIARFYVLLPYSLTIPDGEKFNIYSYIIEDYEVRVYPPRKSDRTTQSDEARDVKLNGINAFQANILHVDFVRDMFDRRESIKCDPPFEFIRQIINSFLCRLRFVVRGSQIKPIDFPNADWRIQYLNDDGTELPKEEGIVRGRLGRNWRFSYMAMNSQIWEDVHRLPPNYLPPEWDSLLLDANYLMPEIGPAIVLAMTALEVFISRILGALAEKSSIPQYLWAWINNRDWWLKQPAVEEQFDSLLRVLVDISIKEDNKLWEAFSHLRRARNTFVHDGVAKVGDRALNQEDGYRLVKAASDIIGYVRERLPEEMRWPQFQYKINVEASFKLFGDKSDSP